MKIEFHYTGQFRVYKAGKTRKWLIETLEKLKFTEGKVEFNFVSTAKIIQINKKFLNHNYCTDIITFPYEIRESEILAEIFICSEQVKKNAHFFGQRFEEEMRRVLVHGILHCAGYHDLTRAETRAMREAEDLYLRNF